MPKSSDKTTVWSEKEAKITHGILRIDIANLVAGRSAMLFTAHAPFAIITGKKGATGALWRASGAHRPPLAGSAKIG